MSQPVKKTVPKIKSKPKKARVVKHSEKLPPATKKSKTPRSQRPHQEYGTSKLEERFARDFLDKLGYRYIYQYKAESIGRYFDFFIPAANVLIEVDGDFWHSYGILYENMTPTQKRNKRVDEQKNLWALSNGIPIIRIWEHDINNNPTGVMRLLRERIGLSKERYDKEKEKNRRH